MASQTATKRGEAKLSIIDNHMVRAPKALSYRCHQGEAEIRILDFKTTWSEFQRATQTATMQGKAKLHILDFKTTWSEF